MKYPRQQQDNTDNDHDLYPEQIYGLVDLLSGTARRMNPDSSPCRIFLAT